MNGNWGREKGRERTGRGNSGSNEIAALTDKDLVACKLVFQTRNMRTFFAECFQVISTHVA